jgi:hypothetical protein
MVDFHNNRTARSKTKDQDLIWHDKYFDHILEWAQQILLKNKNVKHSQCVTICELV